jgi:hypothetical protein
MIHTSTSGRYVGTGKIAEASVLGLFRVTGRSPDLPEVAMMVCRSAEGPISHPLDP